jgi:hypothetical protein
MKRYTYRASLWIYANSEDEANAQLDEFVAACEASPDVPTVSPYSDRTPEADEMHE